MAPPGLMSHQRIIGFGTGNYSWRPCEKLPCRRLISLPILPRGVRACRRAERLTPGRRRGTLATAIAFGTAAAPSPKQPRQLDLADLPALSHYTARDGTQLAYRAYPGGREQAA